MDIKSRLDAWQRVMQMPDIKSRLDEWQKGDWEADPQNVENSRELARDALVMIRYLEDNLGLAQRMLEARSDPTVKALERIAEALELIKNQLILGD